jgi:hypothetical protein
MVIARKTGSNSSKPLIALALLFLTLIGISYIYLLSPDSVLVEPQLAAATAPHQKSSSGQKNKMGFTKTVIKEGNGEKPARGQYVTVHCTGYGKNRDMSQKFWSTKDPGQEPFTFRVGFGEVIRVRYLLWMVDVVCITGIYCQKPSRRPLD